MHFHSHCSNTSLVLSIYHRGCTLECALQLQPLLVTSFPTDDAKVHLCCLQCFVLAFFKVYRKVYPAFACPCCHVWRPSESGSFHNCKNEKELLPGNTTCGSTNGICLFTISAALARRKGHSDSPALHHTIRAFCVKSFPVLL